MDILLLSLLGLSCFILWLVLRKPKSVSDAVDELEALEKQLVAEARAGRAKKLADIAAARKDSSY